MPREPQVTPGVDGILNPALSCKYCKDMGHDMSNCARVKRKEAFKAATASQQSTVAKEGNEKSRGQGIMILASPKFMIPNSFSVNAYTITPNWISYAQRSRAKLLPRLSTLTLWSKEWLCALK